MARISCSPNVSASAACSTAITMASIFANTSRAVGPGAIPESAFASARASSRTRTQTDSQ